MYCLTNSLSFDIPVLYYYTSLDSSIICCLFSGDVYLSFGVSNSLLASLFCERSSAEGVEDFFETLVILSAILLLIKSPVASAVFWIVLFEAVFIAFVVDFLHYQEIFDRIYCLNFYPCFSQKTKLHILLHIFYLKVQMNTFFLYNDCII